jgi:Fe-S-cluster containining protein
MPADRQDILAEASRFEEVFRPMDLATFSHELMAFYQALAETFSRAQATSGLHCPPSCGRCCTYPDVEATPFELIPMALHLVKSQLAEGVLQKIDEQKSQACVMYRPTSADGAQGKCTQYEFRPFVCRAFGVAGIKNKNGESTASVCGTLKSQFPHWESSPADLPQLPQWHARMRVLHPRLMETPLPISLALRQALAIVMLHESESVS